MKFVATKTADQLDLQALHQVSRSGSAPASSIKSVLSYWSAALRCARVTSFCNVHPRILATRPDVLSPRMVRVIENLAGNWHQRTSGWRVCEIETVARQDAGCERLMSVPGIGPIISSAMVAAIGTEMCSLKAGTSRPGSNSSRDKSRPVIAPSSARYRNAAIAPAGSVRSGGMGRADQAEELGTPWAQALDRGGQEAAAPQRAGDCGG